LRRPDFGGGLEVLQENIIFIVVPVVVTFVVVVAAQTFRGHLFGGLFFLEYLIDEVWHRGRGQPDVQLLLAVYGGVPAVTAA